MGRVFYFMQKNVFFLIYSDSDLIVNRIKFQVAYMP